MLDNQNARQARVEAAQDVILNTERDFAGYSLCCERLARALDDAGLLADPADRDAVKWERDQFRKANEALSTRAVRAEAERDALRATVERVRALADGWSKANSWKRSAAKSIRSALDDKAGA